MRILIKLGRVACLGLTLLTILPLEGRGSHALRQAGFPGPRQENEADHQLLSAAGQSRLQELISTAVLPDLQWPDFAKYRDEVIEFYKAFHGRLPWLAER